MREKLVKRVAEFPVKSEIGTLAGFAYLTPFDSVNHMAVVYGKIGDGKNVLARLHRADLIRDVFGGANPVHAALQRIKQEGRGVVVILRDGTAGVPSHSHSVAGHRLRGCPHPAVARGRAWRADSERPGDFLDPAAGVGPLHLCGAGRFRHRNHRHGNHRRLNPLVARSLARKIAGVRRNSPKRCRLVVWACPAAASPCP